MRIAKVLADGKQAAGADVVGCDHAPGRRICCDRGQQLTRHDHLLGNCEGQDGARSGRISLKANCSAIAGVLRQKDVQVRRIEEEPNPTANHDVAIFLRLPGKSNAWTDARIDRRIDRVDPCPLKDNATLAGIEDGQILVAVVQRPFVIVADAVVQVELVRKLPRVLAEDGESVNKYLPLRISTRDGPFL